MAAGHIVGGQCVDVAVSAAVYATSIPPQLTPASPLYFSTVLKTSGSWYYYVYKDGLAVAAHLLPIPSFQSCDTDTFYSQGLPVDFDYTSLAAVWVFALSVVVASYVIAKGMGTLIAMFKS